MTESFAEDRSLCMIYECFLVTDDRFSISLNGDDVQEFDTRWDEVSLSIGKVPDDTLAGLYKMRIRGSDQLKTVLVCVYEQDVEQHNSQLSYQKFKTMVKKCLDQRIRAPMFRGQENERIETGAPANHQSKGKSVSV